MGAFFPVFGDGNTVIAIVVASVGIWLFHFMILRGVQQAAVINSIVTVAKIVPILVFIVLLIFAFKLDLFSANFYGGDLPAAACSSRSARRCWSRCSSSSGIEGASVYSRFAKERSDVGTATILGFVVVTCADGAGDPAALRGAAARRDRRHAPAVDGDVLEAVVGHWGAVFVSVGLLVSVLGAYLAWSLICAEVLFTAAKTKDMPAVFAKENKNKVPATALWVTNIVVQLFVITTYWSRDAFALMLNLTSAMALIPFLFVAAYGLMLDQSRRDL